MCYNTFCDFVSLKNHQITIGISKGDIMKKLGLVGGMRPESTVPLVSIVEVTCDEAIQLNKHKVGLLGTIFTMTGDFFKKPFHSKNIEIITPTMEKMEYINCKISSELELGMVKKETLQSFQKIIKCMAEEEGIEAIILDCTELPLLLNDEVSPVPCLDTMKIHIQHLIDWIVE